MIPPAGPERPLQDKISLLMEETGCDRGEAELALEMCGYQVEEAVRTISRLLKNIAVLKGRFVDPGEGRFGLLLVVLNLKSGALLRARAVLSFNPAVYAVSLDKDWFEFEKFLYGCRLWEGSLPAESLEIEQRLSGHFRETRAWEALRRDPSGALSEDLAGLLRAFLRSPASRLQLKKEILDLGQFHALRNEPEGAARQRAKASPRGLPRAEEPLVLRIALDEEASGIAAQELRAGDMVSARIVDPRDIAQYLARLFGGYSEKGAVPIPVPVEALESGSAGLLVRVRFSGGVCGDAIVPLESRLRAQRHAPQGREGAGLSWWRRFLPGG